MKFCLCLCLLLVLGLSPLFAQFATEDGGGKTAISIQNNSSVNITLNTQDKRIKFDAGLYINLPKKAEKGKPADTARMFLNLYFSGKANSSVSAIFDGFNIAPQAQVGLAGAYPLFTKNKVIIETVPFIDTSDAKSIPFDDVVQTSKLLDSKTLGGIEKALFLAFGVCYKGESYNLFSALNDSMFSYREKVKFYGYECYAGLNFLNNKNDKLPFILAASIGFRNGTNIQDLDQIFIDKVETKDVAGTVTNFTIRKEGFSGTYLTYWSVPAKVEFYLPFVKYNFGFHIFTNADYRKLDNNKQRFQSDIGAGIFFFKSNNPFQPIGGLSLQLSDVFSTNNPKSKTFFERVGLNLLVRISIPLFQFGPN